MRRNLLICGGIAAALWLGWDVANGNWLMPGAVMAVFFLMLAARIMDAPVDAFAAGAVVLGYLVGNRGFAQLHAPGLPLLPGELALGASLAVAFLRSAFSKIFPVRRDALNALLLAWIAFGAGRVAHDVRINGVMALRDFALIYYALFFFLAQGWAQIPAAHSWVRRCLTIGFAFVVPVSAVFNAWPDLVTRLTVRGNPLIFVKGDTAAAFMAAGVFWFGARYCETSRRRWLTLMGLCAAGVVANNNRAGLVALLIGGATLFVLREKRLLRVLLAFCACGALVLAVEAALPRDSGRHSRAFRLFATARTIFDVSGSAVPLSEDLADKPDNNRFRLVWWDAVIAETRADGLWFGLGFGHDLASHFVRRYYPEDNEDFNTRSPHNFLITVFARTGIVGIGTFLAIVGVMAVRTIRCARLRRDTGASADWLAAWMILLTACLGVILEAPMGAVVFWILLGQANSRLGNMLPVGHGDVESPMKSDPSLLRPVGDIQVTRCP